MDKKTTLYIVTTDPKTPDKAAFTAIIGERLEDARGETRYERSDIARACGVDKNTVRMREEGRAVMTAVYWEVVCNMLYIDPWRLLTGRSRRKEVTDLPAHLRNPQPRVRKKRR